MLFVNQYFGRYGRLIILIQLRVLSHMMRPEVKSLTTACISWRLAPLGIDDRLLSHTSCTPHAEKIVEIIPKHGSHVRSMGLEISNTWWTKPEDAIEAEQQDSESKSTECLTPHTATEIVSHCPSITDLQISCPTRKYGTPEEFYLEAFQTRLRLLARRLGNLRQFTLEQFYGSSIYTRCLLEFLKSFPLLKSLSFSWMKCRSPAQGAGFLKSLTQIQQLTHLSLSYIDPHFALWDAGTGLPNLISLELTYTYHGSIRPDQAGSFINTFAPNITSLRLDLASYYNSEDSRPSHLFVLPALTNLKVQHFHRCDFFLSFSGCANLRKFNYINIEASRYPTFSKFIIGSAANFPHLESISIRISSFRPSDDDLLADREALHNFCFRREISLEISLNELFI